MRVTDVGTRARAGVLGDLLRSRRERMQPADVGLPTGSRRRTRGLRREEVALLAAISPTYYLGPDERHWRRFQDAVFDDPTTRFVALEPTVLRARDLSY
jgi:hypothetical protein